MRLPGFHNGHHRQIVQLKLYFFVGFFLFIGAFVQRNKEFNKDRAAQILIILQVPLPEFIQAINRFYFFISDQLQNHFAVAIILITQLSFDFGLSLLTGIVLQL